MQCASPNARWKQYVVVIISGTTINTLSVFRPLFFALFSSFSSLVAQLFFSAAGIDYPFSDRCSSFKSVVRGVMLQDKEMIEAARRWVEEKGWNVEDYDYRMSSLQSCPEGQCSVDVVKRPEDDMDTKELSRLSRVLVS